MIGWIKNQSAMRAPKQSEWCVVLEAIVLSPKLQWCGWVRTLISSKTSVLFTTSPATSPFLSSGATAAFFSFQWCGCTSLSLLNGAVAPLFPFSIVRLHLSFPSQWCGYTSLFPLNGVAAHFSSLSLVRLYLSLFSQFHLYHALNQSLLCCPSPHPITFYYLPKTFSFSSLRSAFFFSSTCWKLLFQKNLFLLCIFPKNHLHSSIIYFLISCPKSTLPKPVWSLLMSVLYTPSHWLHLHGKTTH